MKKFLVNFVRSKVGKIDLQDERSVYIIGEEITIK